MILFICHHTADTCRSGNKIIMSVQQDGFFATQIPHSNAEQPEQQEDEPIRPHIHKPQPDPEAEDPRSLKNLLMAFNKFDRNEKGLISVEEAKEIFEEKGVSIDKFDVHYKIAMPTNLGYVAFDEFLFIFGLCEDDSTEVEVKYELCRKVDMRLVQFLRLLNNYRKKTENQQNYKQAKKSKSKIEEIRERELERRKNYLTILHDHEIAMLEEKQKAHFVEFCDTWDQFMMDYEKTATDLLERLQFKHDAELNEFVVKTREQLGSKMHFSKRVIQLEAKEKYLAKLQEYEQANRIRQEIQQLKIEQLQKKQRSDEESIEIRVASLKKQQLAAINSLLQNIQKDRNDQMKQRKGDSEKLIIRNKALVTEINHKHLESVKKIYEALHNMTLDNERVKAQKKHAQK